MEAIFTSNGKTLRKAYDGLLSGEKFSDYINEVAELVFEQQLNREALDKVLTQNKIKSVEGIHHELLDLLIEYIRFIIKDFVITEEEAEDVEQLKKLFKIREGDFYQYRLKEIKELVHPQFEKLYGKGAIDIEADGEHLVRLQKLFDLGYDQFDQLKEPFILAALESGADICELDTALDTNRVKSKIVALRKELLQKSFNT